MSFPRFSSLLAVLCFIVFQFSTAPAAYADTLHVYDLGSDNGVNFIGMDDAGHVVLSYPQLIGSPVGCRDTADHCYETFLNGVKVPGVSDTLPSYAWDNGAACSPAVPAGYTFVKGVCNNGFSAFEALTPTHVIIPFLFYGTSNPISLGVTGGRSTQLFMDAFGDLVWNEPFSHEEWFEAINAPTPEPSSLALLATGIAAGAAAVRRKLLV